MVGELLEINCLLTLSLLNTQDVLALLVLLNLEQEKGLDHWKIIHAAEEKYKDVKKKS
jgi:hypothetical protein